MKRESWSMQQIISVIFQSVGGLVTAGYIVANLSSHLTSIDKSIEYVKEAQITQAEKIDSVSNDINVIKEALGVYKLSKDSNKKTLTFKD